MKSTNYSAQKCSWTTWSPRRVPSRNDKPFELSICIRRGVFLIPNRCAIKDWIGDEISRTMLSTIWKWWWWSAASAIFPTYCLIPFSDVRIINPSPTSSIDGFKADSAMSSKICCKLATSICFGMRGLLLDEIKQENSLWLYTQPRSSARIGSLTTPDIEILNALQIAYKYPCTFSLSPDGDHESKYLIFDSPTPPLNVECGPRWQKQHTCMLRRWDFRLHAHGIHRCRVRLR